MMTKWPVPLREIDRIKKTLSDNACITSGDQYHLRAPTITVRYRHLFLHYCYSCMSSIPVYQPSDTNPRVQESPLARRLVCLGLELHDPNAACPCSATSHNLANILEHKPLLSFVLVPSFCSSSVLLPLSGPYYSWKDGDAPQFAISSSSGLDSLSVFMALGLALNSYSFFFFGFYCCQ